MFGLGIKISQMKRFNVRVYGFLVNEGGEVLVSDERECGLEFSKFPGGGLEYGEGLRDGLRREFMEECGIAVEVAEHVFTTDGFIKSVFNDSQVIGVYYRVHASQPVQGKFSGKRFDFELGKLQDQVFRWVPLDQLTEDDLTFGMDRAALRVFVSEKRHVAQL